MGFKIRPGADERGEGQNQAERLGGIGEHEIRACIAGGARRHQQQQFISDRFQGLPFNTSLRLPRIALMNRMLGAKGDILLQGPPGIGKTSALELFRETWQKENPTKRSEFITIHRSSSLTQLMQLHDTSNLGLVLFDECHNKKDCVSIIKEFVTKDERFGKVQFVYSLTQHDKSAWQSPLVAEKLSVSALRFLFFLPPLFFLPTSSLFFRVRLSIEEATDLSELLLSGTHFPHLADIQGTPEEKRLLVNTMADQCGLHVGLIWSLAMQYENYAKSRSNNSTQDLTTQDLIQYTLDMELAGSFERVWVGWTDSDHPISKVSQHLRVCITNNLPIPLKILNALRAAFLIDEVNSSGTN